MLPASSGRHPAGRRVLAVGAHADDIEIGCGGTILHLAAAGFPLHVTWVVLAAAGVREREAAGSAAVPEGRRADDRGPQGVPRRLLSPGQGPRSRRCSRTSRAGSPRPGHRPPPRRRPPGPSPGRRAHLEHLPRPSGARVRDPEVRRGPGQPQPVRACRSPPASARWTCCWSSSQPARPPLVHGRHLLGNAAPARRRVEFAVRVRRGVPLPQGDAGPARGGAQ